MGEEWGREATPKDDPGCQNPYTCFFDIQCDNIFSVVTGHSSKLKLQRVLDETRPKDEHQVPTDPPGVFLRHAQCGHFFSGKMFLSINTPILGFTTLKLLSAHREHTAELTTLDIIKIP